MDNTEKKIVVKIKSPNVPYLKNTKVGVLIGIDQIVNILNTLDELFSTVCILFCENTAVKSPKRMDLFISLLRVEFFNNKLTSFCQVLCDKYLLLHIYILCQFDQIDPTSFREVALKKAKIKLSPLKNLRTELELQIIFKSKG